MITLTLLHPIQSIPVQSWVFKDISIIRIGRSTNNEVVLYSAVVSRHHVEVRHNGNEWHIVNVGTNGTYINETRIDEIAAADGMIIRLASSGPKIMIKIDSENDMNLSEGQQKKLANQQSSRSKDTKGTLIADRF